MIKVVNTIQIQKGRVDEVLPRFQTLHGVEGFTGFLGMEVWQKEDTEENDEIKVCTSWETHEDFEAWTNSDSFRARHEKKDKPKEEDPRGPAVIGAKLTKFQVPIKHDVPTE